MTRAGLALGVLAACGGSKGTPDSSATTTDTAAHLACDEDIWPGELVDGACVQPGSIDALCPTLPLIPPEQRPELGCPDFDAVVRGSGLLDGDPGDGWDGNAILLGRCDLPDGRTFDYVFRSEDPFNQGLLILAQFSVDTGQMVSAQKFPVDVQYSGYGSTEARYRRTFCCGGTLGYMLTWGTPHGICSTVVEYEPQDFAQ